MILEYVQISQDTKTFLKTFPYLNNAVLKNDYKIVFQLCAFLGSKSQLSKDEFDNATKRLFNEKQEKYAIPIKWIQEAMKDVALTTPFLKYFHRIVTKLEYVRFAIEFIDEWHA